jgi:transposase
VTQDDLLYRFRLRTIAIAAELGNVRAACRAMGIHPSTYYRWKRQLDRHGPEILRPRERRVPRMANATSPLIERRVVAFALGHPGFGPARIAAELAQPCWGGIQLSANGVWRVLRRHGLQTRARGATGWSPATLPHRRLRGLRRRPSATWTWTIPVSRSSSIASASAGSAVPRAPCGSTPPSTWPRPTPGPCTSPAATPRLSGPAPSPAKWRPTWPPLAEAGAGHERQRPRVPLGHLPAGRGRPRRPAYIHPGRPTPDERVRGAGPADHPGGVLEARLARYLIPKQTGLRLDLERYLRYYNTERAHTGRWTKGRTPEAVLGKPCCGTRPADASPQLGDRTR